MKRCQSEPTISEILADPLVRVLMKADAVDPQTLESALRRTAERIDRSVLVRRQEPASLCC